MTNVEVTHFRTILRESQRESPNGAQSREVLATDTSPDELDRIQSSSERDYAIGSLERQAARMREVQNAIHRLDEGLPGVCASCEEQIHPKRLAALPWARFCITCQEAEDGTRQDRANESEMSLSGAE